MIKYKIEGNNADEFRTMVGNFVAKDTKEKVSNNDKCPVCGGSEFDNMMMSATHYSHANETYTYQGKMCIKCNFIKPNKL